jgi:hypothetical protein
MSDLIIKKNEIGVDVLKDGLAGDDHGKLQA